MRVLQSQAQMSWKKCAFMNNTWCEEIAEYVSDKHPSADTLKRILNESQYNVFELVDKYSHLSIECVEDLLKNIESGLDEHQQNLLQQSLQSSHSVNNDAYSDDGIARAMNQEIVSDSESDDPDAYVGLQDPLSKEGKHLIHKRRSAIHRRIRRVKAKAIAEQGYLSRKVSKRVSKILKECPNLGQTIEEFVKAGNVGADQWRRTGVLTFDGNTNLYESYLWEN